MSNTDYAKAMEEFLARKGVTRCPTVCIVPTHASVAEADRVALRNHEAAREAARQTRLYNRQMRMAS